MEFKVKRQKVKSPMELEKLNVLEDYGLKQKEIARRQREYMKVLSTKMQSRDATIIQSSFENQIDQLRKEKRVLKAKIWVASGAEHTNRNNRTISNIQCHIQCQERLGEDIRRLKTAIQNMEREISRITRHVYDLNRRTVPESTHQLHVAKKRKIMQMLEDRLEVGMRRECAFTAENAELREEMVKILNDRTHFHDTYIKVVQKLNSDKKYLGDLIDHAMLKFEGCIEVYEKIDGLTKRARREDDLHKLEMQSLLRGIELDRSIVKFQDHKSKQRVLADLQEKEYRRRDEFRQKHRKKINLYNQILDKILNYTKSRNVRTVIYKFQQQESRYYSYFNYANEMSYHMTLLNNAVNRLFSEINTLKYDNRNSVQGQLETINDLEKTLENKRNKNHELTRIKDNNDARITKLLQGVQLIQDQCRSNLAPLKVLLGKYDQVSLVNMRLHLKIIERRISEVTAAVYIKERMDDKKTFADYVIKDIDKIFEIPTDLDEVVLTQQCPECAEVDAFNVEEGGGDGGARVLNKEDVSKKLYEKVTQPEMQYRLHSVSQCRLPRSRVIAAKKYGNT